MKTKETLILGVKEVATLLMMTERALRQRLHRGVGAPRPMRLGGRLAWRMEDVEAYIAQQAAAAGADYAAQSANCGNEHNPPRRRGRPSKSGR